MDQRLVRTDRTDKVFSGVCGGLARRFGWNATLVRVLAVASLLLPGPQLLAYGVLWVLLPGEDRA